MISPIGIQFHSKQTIGQRYFGSYAQFSKDGTHYGMYDMDTDIEIFDFDRCNGTFSNYKHVSINDSMFGAGFSFSPNSKMAYASSSHLLYQVNLDSSVLSTSLDTVALWDSTYNPFPPIETGFFFQQLAPDGAEVDLAFASTRDDLQACMVKFPARPVRPPPGIADVQVPTTVTDTFTIAARGKLSGVSAKSPTASAAARCVAKVVRKLVITLPDPAPRKLTVAYPIDWVTPSRQPHPTMGSSP